MLQNMILDVGRFLALMLGPFLAFAAAFIISVTSRVNFRGGSSEVAS